MHCPICGLWRVKDDNGNIRCPDDGWFGNETERLDKPAPEVDEPIIETLPVVVDDRPKKKGK